MDPSFTVVFPVIVTVGATSLTVSQKLDVVCALSLSAAEIVTNCDSSGPSLVSNDQLHVPPSFLITVPTEALSVTVSKPGSLQLPVFVAVPPSLTTTSPFVVTLGATLSTSTAMLPARNDPSSSVTLTLYVLLAGPSA